MPGLSVAGVSRTPHADLDLHLEVGETRPTRALERALRDVIVTGRVAAGSRLPTTRSLAADLGVARTTVSEVYAQLAAEGWLESRVGAGTWVAETAPALPDRAEAEAGEPDGRPRPYWGGYPDASLFPLGEWAAAARRAARRRDARRAWLFGGPARIAPAARRARQLPAPHARRAGERGADRHRPGVQRTARPDVPRHGGGRRAQARGRGVRARRAPGDRRGRRAGTGPGARRRRGGRCQPPRPGHRRRAADPGASVPHRGAAQPARAGARSSRGRSGPAAW